MTDSILPCPFCDEQAVYRSEESGGVVYCDHLWTCPLDGNEKISASVTEWNTRAQPASEPRPVAYRFPWDYDHGNGWCRGTYRYVESMDEVSHEDQSTFREITELFTHPAPAGVVLPPRKVRDEYGYLLHDDKIYNACLDEIKRLNHE